MGGKGGIAHNGYITLYLQINKRSSTIKDTKIIDFHGEYSIFCKVLNVWLAIVKQPEFHFICILVLTSQPCVFALVCVKWLNWADFLIYCEALPVSYNNLSDLKTWFVSVVKPAYSVSHRHLRDRTSTSNSLKIIQPQWCVLSSLWHNPTPARQQGCT